MHIKTIMCTILALVLSACGSNVNPKFDQEKFDTGEYAYIVIDAKNNASSRNVTAFNKFTFKNTDGKSFDMSIIGIKGLMIPAGDYRLTEYRLSGSTTKGNMTFSINLNFSDYVEGAFTIAPGEAIYLGQIETIITKNNASTFKKIFNMGASSSDLEFETKVVDNFDSVKMANFEKESGVAVKKRLINWSKVTMD